MRPTKNNRVRKKEGKKLKNVPTATKDRPTQNSGQVNKKKKKKAKKVPTTVDKRKKMEMEFREAEAQLKKEMEDVRRKRLLEDNLEEDRTIRQLAKKLKLHKKKKKEKDEPEDPRKKVEVQSKKKIDNDDDLLDDEDSEGDIDNSEEEDDYDMDDSEEFIDDSDEDCTISQLEKELKLNTKSVKEPKAPKVVKESKVAKKEPKEKVWEDIYGRLRNTDGTIVDEKALKQEEAPTTTKYVPPGKRGNQSVRDKILKTIKGLLNRLAESNIHGISQQVEELYMTNSRNEMNETLMEQYLLSLASTVTISERIIMEHIMLITILHANVGSEIGAFFIQSTIQKFRKLYDETPNLEETKELHNLALMISSMYHFKIIGSGLIFDVLKFLADGFKAKDIELILVILRCVGFRLRKDDPISLKNLVLLLQQQATSGSELATDSRVKFMLDILLAIKNNNMTKIPNYDPSYGEHLLKMLKQHFHKGNYVVELNVSMEDLLNADKNGRWWVVGSAWTNDKETSQPASSKESTILSPVVSSKVKTKLLAKAKQFGMNTDTRKNIFCIIMTAEDYLDTFEKLMHLGLKNQQEREIIHVIIYCCLHEKKYNPYYSLILSKLCAVDRRFMYTTPFKLEIAEYAKKLGQRKASRLFCISQRRVGEWMKLHNSSCPDTSNQSEKVETQKSTGSTFEETGTCSPPSSKKQHLNVDFSEEPSCTKSVSAQCSKQVLDMNVEKEVFTWMQSLLATNIKPSSTEIRNKALEMYRSKGYDTIKCSYGWYRRWEKRFNIGGTVHENCDPILLSWLLEHYDNNNLVTYADLRSYGKESLSGLKSTFKASPGWATRFFKRNHVLINWDGYYEGDLPPNLQSKVNTFLQDVAKIKSSEFGSAQIGCMDEIPLSFASSASNEKDVGESGQISRLRKVSVKNCEATVLLSLRADGVLNPPMVVVKAQDASSLNQVYSISDDHPVVVFYAKSTEPTIEALDKWLDLIWLKNSQQPSLLFTDSYDLHLQMRTNATGYGIRQEIFPSGCSCKLQPINVYARKTFQKLIEINWEDYLRKNSNEPKIKLPSTNEIIAWIHLSIETMKTESHKNKLVDSFKKVGLLLQGQG